VVRMELPLRFVRLGTISADLENLGHDLWLLRLSRVFYRVYIYF